MPETSHNFSQQNSQSPKVAIFLHEKLQENTGQCASSFFGGRLKHHPKNGHVVRVPCVGQLVEDCVLQQGCQIIRVGNTELFDAGEEKVDVGLRLQPQLGQQHHHLHIGLCVRDTVEGHSTQKLLCRARYLGVHHPHFQAGGC